MAAVIIDSADHGDICAELESLRLGKSPRLHWREESSTRQFLIAGRIAAMPMRGIVAVHLHDRDVRAERARRRCLERLLVELDQLHVPEAFIESRSREQDHSDLLLVMAVRRSGVLSKNIMIEWRSSYQEPLLWAADAVVGATTWWLDGHAAGLDLLHEKVSVIDLD
ncbi:hypothetical protein [Microbispora triticiradicis]|uniref:hypothetical protein n=1 Tax=Microbispora triticiradicis TaxID=2200763 RepID=UPI001AD6CA7C|nr:hypothetical protein [Microbispora triticiradicis]